MNKELTKNMRYEVYKKAKEIFVQYHKASGRFTTMCSALEMAITYFFGGTHKPQVEDLQEGKIKVEWDWK